MLKRITITLVTLAVLFFAALAAAYYSLPHLFKEPLVQLNRTLSGLSERTIRIGPHQVHYLEGGSGKPVLLLHGIFAEKDHWVDFARGLTDGYRVIVPDLPGFGESSRLADQPYDYAAQTERLKSLVDALGVERVHLAGSSMGGTIAALFAIRYPERVASVAFIGAPHGIRSASQSVMDELIEAGEMPLVARDGTEFDRMMELLFSQRPFLPYPILHAARSDAIWAAQSNVRIWNEQLKNRYLLHDRIGSLTVPAFALWGEQDKIFNVSGADVLRQRLKQIQVQTLPGLGHLPMMEAPKQTSAAYAAFLAGGGQH